MKFTTKPETETETETETAAEYMRKLRAMPEPAYIQAQEEGEFAAREEEAFASARVVFELFRALEKAFAELEAARGSAETGAVAEALWRARGEVLYALAAAMHNVRNAALLAACTQP